MTSKGRPPGTSPASALTGALGCKHAPIREAQRGPTVTLVRYALSMGTRQQAADYLGITRSTLQVILAKNPDILGPKKKVKKSARDT